MHFMRADFFRLKEMRFWMPHFRHMQFKPVRYSMFHLLGFFDPRRFVAHERLSMLYLSLMNSHVSTSLNTDFSPVLTVIHTSLKTLHRVASFNRLDSESHGCF